MQDHPKHLKRLYQLNSNHLGDNRQEIVKRIRELSLDDLLLAYHYLLKDRQSWGKYLIDTHTDSFFIDKFVKEYNVFTLTVLAKLIITKRHHQKQLLTPTRL
jgi:hypothetical protein